MINGENTIVQCIHCSAVKPENCAVILCGNRPILAGLLMLSTSFGMCSKSESVRTFLAFQSCSNRFAVPKNKLCIEMTPNNVEVR